MFCKKSRIPCFFFLYACRFLFFVIEARNLPDPVKTEIFSGKTEIVSIFTAKTGNPAKRYIDKLTSLN